MTDIALEPLSDAATRAAIVSRLDSTLFVEAGAGTGKTSALVARIVALIQSGIELREIAAITFTEAAAAELRQRVHSELEQLAFDPAKHALASRALEQLDEAAITTIHGFAARLLSEHPLEAGLPLQLRVLDEIESSLRFDHDVAAFLDSFFDDRLDSTLASACVAIGVTPVHLRELLGDVDELRSRFEATGGVSYQLDDAFRRLVHERSSLVASELRLAIRKRADCCNDEDLLARRLDELARHLEAFDAARDWLDELTFLVELASQRVSRLGRAENWRDAVVTEVRAAVQRFEATRHDAVFELVDLVLRALLSCIESVVGEWAKQRRSTGELTFQDLLLLAADVLKTRREVRRGARDRYRKILVDEFQDTDPVQLDIVLTLSVASDEEPMEPGRLFFVGDPRQSIYRFRGAHPELYERSRRGAYCDETLELSTNFRSVPGIVRFVNDSFSALKSLVDSATDEPTSTGWRKSAFALHAARSSAETDPPVVLLGGALDATHARERREIEAEAVASFVASQLGGETVIDDGGAVRRTRGSDVAILVPRRTGLAQLEAALDRVGVRYQLESSSLVFNSAEVVDVLDCLTALNRPGDERAVLGALRTPLFACGDDELLEYAQAGGRWRFDEVAAFSLDSPVGSALEYLRDLQQHVQRFGTYSAACRLIDERYVFELCAASRHPLEAMRRVQILLDELRAFVDGGRSSLSEFLAYAALQRNERVRRVDAASKHGDDDAVRITTIHGAKGLEFPVVVLAELGGAANGSPKRVRVLRNAGGGLEVRLGEERVTSGFAEVHEAERRAERDEHHRLCYVGATRARDRLALSLFHRPAASPSGRSLAEWLWLAASEAPHTWRRMEKSATAVREAPVPVPSAWEPEGSNDFGSALQQQRALLQELARRSGARRAVAASELDRIDQAPANERRRSHASMAFKKDELTSMSQRASASAVGRAVHAVLESTLDSSLDALEQVCRNAALLEGVPLEGHVVFELVTAALRAPSIVEARASARCFRELPVTAVIEGRVLEAVVDLCFEHHGELVVVDYKTDAVADRQDALRVAPRYRLQAGAYALALGAALQVPVKKVVLVFLASPDGAIELEIDQLSSAMADANAALLRAVSSRDEPSWQ